MEENNSLDGFTKESELNPYEDIKYFSEKRDNAIERFVRTLRKNEYDVAELHKQLDGIVRINNQIELMEDALVIFITTSQKT